MSYARFGEKSDVYVFLSVRGCLECCACALLKDSDGGPYCAHSTEEMLEHLYDHLDAEHVVPDYCFDGLLHDAEENDAWIKDPTTELG